MLFSFLYIYIYFLNKKRRKEERKKKIGKEEEEEEETRCTIIMMIIIDEQKNRTISFILLYLTHLDWAQRSFNYHFIQLLFCTMAANYRLQYIYIYNNIIYTNIDALH